MLKGKKNKKFFPINFNPKVVTKTQNLKPIYMSNGSFFIFRKKTFKKYNNRIGNNPYYYKLKFPESVEIDNKEDLNLARIIKVAYPFLKNSFANLPFFQLGIIWEYVLLKPQVH